MEIIDEEPVYAVLYKGESVEVIGIDDESAVIFYRGAEHVVSAADLTIVPANEAAEALGDPAKVTEA